MKIKLLFLIFFFSNILNIKAQEKFQVGVNIFNFFTSFPSRFEMSFQKKNSDENSTINPVLILGINSGNKFMTNTGGISQNIIHQYANRSQYIKVGIDLITKRKENGCENYAEFLVGYSNNTASNKVTFKGSLYDNLYYSDETKFNAVILQAWYMTEFKIYQNFIGSLGLGITSMKINNNSNPEVPISEVGGGALFLEIKNEIQYYIAPTIKFSVHYKF